MRNNMAYNKLKTKCILWWNFFSTIAFLWITSADPLPNAYSRTSVSVVGSHQAVGLKLAGLLVDRSRLSSNAVSLPVDFSLDEWSVNWQKPAKRTKRRHEPHVIDLPSAAVSGEVQRVDTTSDIVGPPIAISKPYFEATWPRNVSAILGQSAVLKCRTRLLGERMLSWIRQRDLHVLTSALISYTSDGRFSVHHQPSSDDWELRISSVQARDAGFYECQVNTEPKINWPIFLQVHTGQAQIAGPSEVHVRQGSTLSLTCSLRGTLQGQDSNLTWYHDNQPILLETARNSLSLATERSENFISSRLLLPRASAADGGNYTCRPTDALPASVLVHVLNGEHPAAMQHGNRSGGGSPLPNFVHVLSAITLLCWNFNWYGRINLLRR